MAAVVKQSTAVATAVRQDAAMAATTNGGVAAINREVAAVTAVTAVNGEVAALAAVAMVAVGGEVAPVMEWQQ